MTANGDKADEKAPYEPYQFRKIRMRAGARGYEAGADSKPHPFLTLGPEILWAQGILLSALITEALGRSEKQKYFDKKVCFCRPDGSVDRLRSTKTGRLEDSYVDVQNLWTFSRKHFDDHTDWQNMLSVKDDVHRRLVRESIKEHIAWRESDSLEDDWKVGRIVSVTLSTAQARDGRAADIETVRTTLEAAAKITIPSKWITGKSIRFPAVILASDDYARRELLKDPWPFVTVLPLVLLQGEEPSTGCYVADDNERKYFVLTACMLTLDYQESALGGQPPSVTQGHPEFKRKPRISGAEYAGIRAQTFTALGIEV